MTYYPSIKESSKNSAVKRTFEQLLSNLPKLPSNYIDSMTFGKLAAIYIYIAENNDFHGDYIYAFNALVFQQLQQGQVPLYIVKDKTFYSCRDTEFVRNDLDIIPLPAISTQQTFCLFLPQGLLVTPQKTTIEFIWIKVSINPTAEKYRLALQ